MPYIRNFSSHPKKTPKKTAFSGNLSIIISIVGLIVSGLGFGWNYYTSNRTWKSLSMGRIEVQDLHMNRYKKLSQKDIDTLQRLGYNLRYYLDQNGETYYINFNLAYCKPMSTDYIATSELDTIRILKSANIPLHSSGVIFFKIFHPLMSFKNIGVTDATIDTLIIGMKLFPDIIFANDKWPVVYNMEAPAMLGPAESITPLIELRTPNNSPHLLDSIIFKIQLSYTNVDGGKKNSIVFYKYYFLFDLWSTPDYKNTKLGLERFDWTNKALFGN